MSPPKIPSAEDRAEAERYAKRYSPQMAGACTLRDDLNVLASAVAEALATCRDRERERAAGIAKNFDCYRNNDAWTDYDTDTGSYIVADALCAAIARAIIAPDLDGGRAGT